MTLLRLLTVVFVAGATFALTCAVAQSFASWAIPVIVAAALGYVCWRLRK